MSTDARDRATLESLGALWVQRVGLTTNEAAELLAATTSHGNIPEPLRVAHIIAGGVERRPREAWATM